MFCLLAATFPALLKGLCVEVGTDDCCRNDKLPTHRSEDEKGSRPFPSDVGLVVLLPTFPLCPIHSVVEW
jgi:hypothetical protein